eukprot:maker-scaffold_1-snap-gene-15.42-mRNA-1 protein AED:0.18 eAED:0.19 QI:0/0/0/1/1/1/2/0/759
MNKYFKQTTRTIKNYPSTHSQFKRMKYLQKTSVNTDYISVLNYWFFEDDGIPLANKPNLNKNLWFIPKENKTKKKETDEEIKTKFSTLLLQTQEMDISKLPKKLKSSSSNTVFTLDLLAKIIVLDQFTRHIHRNDETLIKNNSLKASKLTEFLLKNNLHLLLQPEKLTFLLMPFRHLPQKQKWKECLKMIKQSEQNFSSSLQILSSFENATIKRLDSVQESSNQDFSDVEILAQECKDYYKSVFEVKDAYENLFSTEKRFEMQREDIYKRLVQFILEQNDKILEIKKNPVPTKIELNLFISLSGGVDSMVIASMLYFIKKNKDLLCLDVLNSRGSKSSIPVQNLHKKKRKFLEKYQNIKLDINLVAVHIDYRNRKESKAEADFVQRWCGKHEIDLNLTTITDFKRGVTNREVYEEETRKIRFAAYKSALKKYNSNPNSKSVGVFFGHHAGDLEENVLCNVLKGASILDLSGMGFISKNDGIKIFRPLLTHQKNFIFGFAHKYKVPYFKDTTPKWSARYKLRNEILPSLGETFGSGFAGHLSQLSKQSDEISELTKELLFKPEFEKIQFGKIGTLITVPESSLRNSTIFWREILQYVCHKMDTNSVHMKPVFVLVEMLEKIQENGGKLKNNQNLCWIELKHSNRSFIANSEEKELHLGIFQEDAFDSNHWNVQIQEVDEEEKTNFNVFEFVKSGKFEYFVRGNSAGELQLCEDWKQLKANFSLRRMNKNLKQILPLIKGPEQGNKIFRVIFEKKKSKNCL